MFGHILQQRHEPLGEAHEEGGGLDARRQRRRIGIVEHDEVDIARVVQLEGTLLAHGQHRVAAALRRPRRIGKRKPAHAMGFAQQPVHRRLQAGIGKAGECGGHRGERPLPTGIGNGDEQCGFRLGGAQGLHEGRLAGTFRRHPQAGDGAVQQGLGICDKGFRREVRICKHEVAQIGRSAGEAIDEIRPGRVAQCIGHGVAEAPHGRGVERRRQPRCVLSGHGGWFSWQRAAAEAPAWRGARGRCRPARAHLHAAS